MDFQPDWNSILSEAFDLSNPTANSTHVPVSTYFRNPAKVIKSGSRNNSPRHLGRRKTTIIPASQRKPDFESHRASVPQWQIQNTGRPMSWHPNTYYGQNHPIDCLKSQAILASNDFTTTTSTTAVHGLVTPMTYPLMDEPHIQELMTPLDELNAHQVEYGYKTYEGNGDQSWFLPESQKLDPYFMNGGLDQGNLPQQFWHLPSHPLAMTRIPTAPTSPDFLPIQSNQDSSPLMLDISSLDVQSEGEELVAMGLYDSPAEVQSSSFSRGLTSAEIGRRSLKLEDSFDPVSEKDDAEHEEDDGDNDNDDDADDEEHADERSRQEEEGLIIQSNNTIGFPAYYHDQYSQDIDRSNLSGQTFFFHHDISNEHIPITPETYMPNTNYVNNAGYMMPMTTAYPPDQPVHGWI